MDQSIKLSIDARKNAVYNAYNITDSSIKNKVEDLFNRINAFGETCSDVMDFETKFASSELNQEYINLFTEIATSCSQIEYKSEPRDDIKSDADYIMDDASSEAKYIAEDITQPMRREAYQATYDAVRDVPVVSEVMEANQYVDMFNKLTGKNKDDNE
jgi:hypothetical protein